MDGWEAGRLAGWGVNVAKCPFGTPIYTFRATIPEAWEAWEAGRLAGCLLTYQRSRSEPLYISFRATIPEAWEAWEAGRLEGWLAGWGVKGPCGVFGTHIYIWRWIFLRGMKQYET